MKDLRPLLIDCRIELRKLQRDFQKSQLCERLDLMLQAVTAADVSGNTSPAAVAAAQISQTRMPVIQAAASPEKTLTSNQVALAWQTAARDLKFTHPDIYQGLSDKVMRLLGAKSLVDPATEILQLQAQAQTHEKTAGAVADQLRLAQLERDSLLAALGEAAPELTGGDDRLAIGLAQIKQLAAHGASQQAPSSHGHAAPAVAKGPSDPTIPTPDILANVAQGVRKFTDDQRNWAVGEGMVLSGFQFTPFELLEQGDQALAALILEKQRG